MSQPNVPIARPLVGEEEKAAVLEVLDSGQLAQGSRVDAFEREFAEYVGTAHAIAVNSGTAALIVAVQAHGIGPGDEVITSPFSFIATATSIIASNATPVFADICADDFNLDPAAVEAAITPRTKAIMPVHLYGQAARMDELEAICKRHNLVLIEDAAQAHGTEYRGKRAGSFGTGCFSFYPTKNMTTGEGGIITTNDDALSRRCRMIRAHGSEVRYLHEVFGLNWRMTDLSAAIGRVQLRHLEEWNEARIRNAEGLTRRINERELNGLVTPPRVLEGNRHVFHQYTVRIANDRDGVQQRLQAAGIGTGVHYPIPIHRQPIIEEKGYGGGNFPISEQAAREVLSLPVHPSLTDEDLDRIVAALEAAVRG